MPRPLRIHFPNACYHVMNRGARRSAVFTNNIHRKMFLDLLEESHTMYGLKVFAYCLMDNHYHLLVSTPDANLASIMKYINGGYTKRYNRLQKSDGALFRGRYKAKLIGDDCYRLIVSRYIHLNPVEASMVNHPADYIWSSYRAYIGISESPIWLFKDEIINQLAGTKILSHVKNYQDYVEEKQMEEINIFTSEKNTGPIFGSELFKKKILSEIDIVSIVQSCSADLKRAQKKPSIEMIINEVCLFYNISRVVLMECKPSRRNWPKSVSIYICRKDFGHLLKDISQTFGFYRYEAVSAAIRKCNVRLTAKPVLFDEIGIIVARIKAKILEA